jgi:nucleoside-diphosphate-sugar epimerase
VEQIRGDRGDAGALERCVADRRFDVVIDMIAYTPAEAESDIRAFAGRCEQLIFCSTVCTYGVKVPPGVVVDESFPQEPISSYGRNKLACEQLLLRAHQEKRFNVTIIRPSSTYGPGGNLIDNLTFDTPAWDRIERGLPVLCAGDGLGLWVSTHRDDCGKAFAYAALNPKTYGQAYNATREVNFTWRDYYRQAAAALGKEAQVVFMPAGWILKHSAERFGLLREITQFHGAYTSRKAMGDMPEFRCEIDFVDGARDTLADMKRRGVWRKSADDALYESMVQSALKMGMEPVTL